MKKTINKGFTLVELIIVITILAILATVAFVSFQGYAGQTRDAKKQSELDNLRNKMEVLIAANSLSPISFVSYDSAYTISTGINYAGTGVATGSTSYIAGAINYAAIGADSTKYTYPYKIGAVYYNGNYEYQIATKLENDSIVTIGNYTPRTITGTTASGSTYSTANNTLTLTGTAGVGMFQAGDYIKTTAGSSGAYITKVSQDGTVLTLTNGSSTYASTGISLKSNEDTYLLLTGSLSKQ